MRFRSPAILIVFSIIFLSFGTASARDMGLSKGDAEDVGVSSQRLEKITQAFSKEIAEKKLPGAVVLVARDGKIIYEGTFGTLTPGGGAPMSKDALFRIYSMTKPLMSVGLMLLVEDGLVELTDPVSKFLPPFKEMQVATAEGTIVPAAPAS